MILRIIGQCLRLSQIAHAHLHFPFLMVSLWYFLRLPQALHWHFHMEHIHMILTAMRNTWVGLS